MPVDEVASANLAELSGPSQEQHLTPEDGYSGPDPSEPTMETQSAGSGHTQQLPSPQRRADFFYYKSSTAGFEHGHLGMYRNFTWVIEAANSNLGVRRIEIAKRKVPRGTYVLKYTKSTKDHRISASDWANSKDGAKYRSWYKTNRTAAAPFNCSQLVWAAYRRASGVDLDRNGGSWVMPLDVATASGVVYYDYV